jgi:diguanylate cyclase (GGDEF)-like protein/PAS domain S-box-containing protein
MDQKLAIQTEQLRQLLARGRASIFISALLAVILAYMQYGTVSTFVLIIWLFTIVLVSLFRFMLVVAHKLSPTQNGDTTRIRLMWFRAGVLASGLTWGSTSYLLFPEHDMAHQMLLIFILSGMTAGSVVAYSADRYCAIGYSVSTLAPLILHLFITGDSLSVTMGIAGSIYLGFMIVTLRHISKNVSDNIMLRLEGEAREVALNESRERFRILVELTPEAIAVHRDGKFVYVNPATIELFDAHSAQELIGKSVFDLIHPDFHQIVMDRIKKNADDDLVAPMIEEKFLTLTGREIEVEVQGTAIMYDGEPAIHAVLHNITARKQAEAKLLLSASVFTHASEGILITSKDGTILDVNQSFTDITGYSKEEAIGKNPRILSSGRQEKEYFTTMFRELHEQGYYYGEIWNKRKNGEIYPEMQTISAVQDEQGNILHYVSLFSDITLRKQAETEIHNLAFYDALTGLPNRRLLMDRLRAALSSSVRSRQFGAVLFLDMDRFKTLNDTLGHDHGDLLLIEVAHRIQSCLRETDTVARLGGDEFVVLLEDIDVHSETATQKTAHLAEKIRITLSMPYQLRDYEYISTPSIGVTLYFGSENSADTLLKYADMAMYQVKESGRNAIRFFDPDMQLAVEYRAALETDLSHAVLEQQLQLHYQIQVNDEHRPIGAEALVRWMHPKRGLVSPAQFITIAEESSLILSIGNWVLETACGQLAAWSKCEFTSNLTLAVNVSAQQFKQPEFVSMVAAVLQYYAIDASRLKLELTESVVLNDVTDIVSKMHALKALRVKLSMDDFGTGYSSLSYLKQLPLDQLKIDQSFVRDMTSDQNDAVMVQTIIDLAGNFRLNVIAEGVETEAQLTLLNQLGCNAYQGYYFSKPIPIEQFELLLKSASFGNS